MTENHDIRTSRSLSERTERHRTHHDWAAPKSIAETILEAIGDVDPTFDPMSAVPLQSFVDAEALDRLFEPTQNDETPSTGMVTFRYDTYVVTVSANGLVTVREYDRSDGENGVLE